MAGGIELAILPPMLAKKSLKASATDFPSTSSMLSLIILVGA